MRNAASTSGGYLLSVVNGVAEPIVVVGANRRIEMMNRAARDFMGGEDYQFCYQAFHRRESPCVPSNKDFRCTMDEVFKTKRPVTEIHEHFRKDGEVRLVEILASPLKETEGDIIGFVASLRDITDRTRAQKAVESAKRQWERTFDIIPDLIAVMDVECRFVKMNKAFAKKLGVGLKDVVGRKCQELICGPGGSEACCPRPQAASRGGERTVEAQVFGGDYLISISPILDYGGEPAGWVEVFRDITEIKRTEEMLAASLREKEVLLREVHHRVKNNMQVISSLLSLQGRLIKDTPYASAFREAQDRIKAMAIVHEKIYESKDFTKTDIRDYVSKIANGIFRSYGVNIDRIALNMDIEDGRLSIDSAVPCGLIVNELLSNSLKHAFPDKEKGSINIAFHPAEGGWFELRVSDDGAGLPNELDFRQTKTLGLQLVNALVKQLNGSIELNGRAGTEFSIRFKEAGVKHAVR